MNRRHKQEKQARKPAPPQHRIIPALDWSGRVYLVEGTPYTFPIHILQKTMPIKLIIMIRCMAVGEKLELRRGNSEPFNLVRES